MGDYTSAYGSNFETVDITHRSIRTQAENLKAASVNKSEEVEQSDFTTVPKILTVERAIHYFEDNAKGELENLYKFTAECLRGYLDRSVTVSESEETNE